jgi:hypothetical protein
MTPIANDPQLKQPLKQPELGPKGAPAPHSVDEPMNPQGQGSEPDYFPGKPGNDLPKFRIVARRPRLIVGRLQAN